MTVPGRTPDRHPGAVRELFHQLLNIDEYPGALRNARLYVDFWLNWAQAFSLDPERASPDRRFFPYTPQALDKRMEQIYQELVDDA